MRAINFNIRKGNEFELKGIIYNPLKLEDCNNCDTEWKTAKRRLRNATFKILLQDWQEQWITADKVTNLFFPSISKRLKMEWIQVNHYTCQFLTGDGDFAVKLNSMRLKDSPLCQCGEAEDVTTYPTRLP